MPHFYIGLFSYLSMNHGQDQFLVIPSDSYLMTRQKSELVFAVQDVSRPLLLIYQQSALKIFTSERRKIFILNVTELFLFLQTAIDRILKMTGIVFKVTTQLDSSVVILYLLCIERKK